MDPSVEQLVAFKALVVAKLPLAVDVTAAYEKTKDKIAFYAGIREALSQSTKKAAAPAPASAAHVSAPVAAAASSGGQNGAGGASASAAKPKSATPCFAFKETGVCKNEKCRFSHDAPSKAAPATAAAAPASGGAAAAAPAPAAAANSLAALRDMLSGKNKTPPPAAPAPISYASVAAASNKTKPTPAPTPAPAPAPAPAASQAPQSAQQPSMPPTTMPRPTPLEMPSGPSAQPPSAMAREEPQGQYTLPPGSSAVGSGSSRAPSPRSLAPGMSLPPGLGPSLKPPPNLDPPRQASAPLAGQGPEGGWDGINNAGAGAGGMQGLVPSPAGPGQGQMQLPPGLRVVPFTEFEQPHTHQQQSADHQQPISAQEPLSPPRGQPDQQQPQQPDQLKQQQQQQQQQLLMQQQMQQQMQQLTPQQYQLMMQYQQQQQLMQQQQQQQRLVYAQRLPGHMQPFDGPDGPAYPHAPFGPPVQPAMMMDSSNPYLNNNGRGLMPMQLDPRDPRADIFNNNQYRPPMPPPMGQPMGHQGAGMPLAPPGMQGGSFPANGMLGFGGGGMLDPMSMGPGGHGQDRRDPREGERGPPGGEQRGGGSHSVGGLLGSSHGHGGHHSNNAGLFGDHINNNNHHGPKLGGPNMGLYGGPSNAAGLIGGLIRPQGPDYRNMGLISGGRSGLGLMDGRDMGPFHRDQGGRDPRDMRQGGGGMGRDLGAGLGGNAFRRPEEREFRPPAPGSLEAVLLAKAAEQQPKKSLGLYRITRNQPGTISIFVQGRAGEDILLDIDDLQLKPGTFMDIHWELPKSVYSDPSQGDLCLGLVRYGAGSNYPCIVAKSLAKNGRSTVQAKDMFGNEVMQGKVQFHAPKSAGVFVYRLFDNISKERAMVTYATSITFVVELADLDVTMNLKHALDSFEAKAPARALTQLNSTVKGMRSPGKPLQGEHPQVLLQRCMYALFELIEEGVKLLQRAKEKEKEKERGRGERDESAIGLVEERIHNRSEDEFWSSVRLCSRLQVESHETIEAVRSRKIAWLMLTESQKTYAEESLLRYSTFLHRHFASPDDLVDGVVSEFGFRPAVKELPALPAAQGRQIFAAIDRSISELLPSLMPGPEFEPMREAARARIERTIRSCAILPEETVVVLYGSSKNSFGSNSADLDMCLMLPPGRDVPLDDKPAMIEAIGDALRSVGMTDVRPRSTARIPIVQFVDPLTGIECDISFNNPLALCNTRLLRTYSETDPRVRPLVYIIKHWAKNRQINCPGDGTLSSYGFILCLLHFLQTRQPPVVPNLQKLPQEWAGEVISASAAANPNSYEIELNPVDSTPCKTYFYSPPDEKTRELLSKYGSANKESVAELLAGFFAYYSHDFNFRHTVVSIQAGQAITKISKSEADGWTQHERLGIEDPFETSYDIAHVIKSQQMLYIHKELLRAHTLISRTFQASATPTDGLPSSIDASLLLAALVETAEPPPFSLVAKESGRGDRDDEGEW